MNRSCFEVESDSPSRLLASHIECREEIRRVDEGSAGLGQVSRWELGRIDGELES